MDRRTFTGSCIGGLLAAPLAVAQTQTVAPAGNRGVPRVGRLSEGGPSDFTMFREAMRLLGHDRIVMEDRPALGVYARLPELAAELVALKVDAIWTPGSGATQAAMAATRTIPIVMVSGDALAAGLVRNLARPEANVTGLTLVGTEVVGKRLEVMLQFTPRIERMVAVMPGVGTSTVPIVAEWLRQSEAAAQALRLDFGAHELPMDSTQWDAHFQSLAARPGTALSLMESPLFFSARELLATLAVKHRLPMSCTFQEQVRAGGLFSYGVTLTYITGRVAYYVARVLGGARPGELPVEQPTKYELSLNLRTAQALGLAVPRSLSLRADEVIQ